MLKFNDYPGGGREAYMRYATPVRRLIRELGGRHLFYGHPMGPDGSSFFDEFILNEYPSERSFDEMQASAEYQAVWPFLAQGLHAGGGRNYAGDNFFAQALNWEGVRSYSDRPYTFTPHTESESETAHESTLVMLNLSSFKEGGQESYRLYLSALDKIHEAQGSRALYRGLAVSSGRRGEEWDSVELVEYPSIQVFETMQEKPEFQEIAPLRSAGIERTESHRLAPLARPGL